MVQNFNSIRDQTLEVLLAGSQQENLELTDEDREWMKELALGKEME